MSLSTVTAATANPWVRILDSLEKKVNRHSYDTWLKPTRYSHARGNILVVRVPTPEFRQIGDRYGDLIREAIEKLELKFETWVRHRRGQARPPPCADGGFAPPAGRPRPAPGPLDWDRPPSSIPSIPFDASSSAPPTSSRTPPPAVAERPPVYNPPFLYGGGMGKTTDAGHRARGQKRQPQSAICYLTAEKFTNEVIHALRFERMVGFRDKYRFVDLLLLDDIQFLAGRERTQEEFFHTFNAPTTPKQIVITSDCPPGSWRRSRTAALALRVGPDRRHPAARPGDQGRHPAEEGGAGARPCPPMWRCSSPPTR
jgi:chromosomal replication initiator protein